MEDRIMGTIEKLERAEAERESRRLNDLDQGVLAQLIRSGEESERGATEEAGDTVAGGQEIIAEARKDYAEGDMEEAMNRG